MIIFSRLSVVSILTAVSVTGCATPEWPIQTQIRAEVEGPKAYRSNTKAPVFSLPTTVVVRKGDSVFALSQRHSVSMRSIILANGLQPPFVLKLGERIKLPREPRYMVIKGDTLSQIAEKKGVGMYELVRLNALKPPYTIYVGQNLRLPLQSNRRSMRSIALSSSQNVKTISVSPQISKGINEQMVDPLSVPKQVPTWARATETETETETETSQVNVNVSQSSRQPSVVGSIARPAPRAGKRFQWPVKGRVISGFGSKSKGLRNDGINIAAPRGTPVLAADNGVVVYAGNELRGFGKLILVKHAEGWVSAYAHNESFLVQRGENVRKGQQIAKVGSSGGVVLPQLHFELRKGRHAKDPRKHLQKA